MHPQLEEIVRDFELASERLRSLRSRHAESAWRTRPPDGGWSAAECIAHLNLSSEALLPLLDEALTRARGSGRRAPGRFRRDPVGWLIWRVSRPSSRVRTKTIASFVPGADAPLDATLADFERFQDEQIRRTREADGLAIQDIRLVSPFDARVKYSLYSALTILSVHQLRHLNQAERALVATTMGASPS